MSKRTLEELEKLKQELREASQRESRPTGSHQRGLEQLMAAEAAAPTRGPTRPLKPVIGGALVLAALAAWRLWTVDDAPPTMPSAVDAGSALVVTVPVPREPQTLDAGAPAVEQPQFDAGKTDPPGVDAGSIRAVRPSRSPTEIPDQLARELELLDAARAALAARPTDTLVTLDGYAREFPRGALKVEAELIRVEALLATGRSREAEALARRLIAADRDGLVRKRLSRLLDGGM